MKVETTSPLFIRVLWMQHPFSCNSRTRWYPPSGCCLNGSVVLRPLLLSAHTVWSIFWLYGSIAATLMQYKCAQQGLFLCLFWLVASASCVYVCEMGMHATCCVFSVNCLVLLVWKLLLFLWIKQRKYRI